MVSLNDLGIFTRGRYKIAYDNKLSDKP